MDQASTLQLAPIEQSDRIQPLDVMCGIILFGILLININSFGLANSYIDLTVAGGFTGWNLYTWIGTILFFEGTMRGLFSLLFGVGMFIFLDCLTKRGAGIKAADIFIRRLMWLPVFGLIHGYLLLWTGEILYDYALMGFLVYSFKNMAPKKLITAAVILVLAGMVWNYSDFRKTQKLVGDVSVIDSFEAGNKELTKELKEIQTEWDKIKEEPSPEFIAEFNSSMEKGYFGVVAFLAPLNLHFDTWMSYRYGLWDVLCMLSVICMIVFTGVGFGLFGKLQRTELLYIVFPIWIFQLILSPIWLRYFHYVPLEWLWRNLSYRKVHSFRKESPQPILSHGNLDPLNTGN